MKNLNYIPTNRIEAFSDGIIAIIITIMVFDLKLQEIPTDENVWNELIKLAPKFASYTLSFITVAIMWVNHHQMLHQIKHTDGRLLWYNINLLFWMSLIPFVTNFIGSNPLLWQASFFYGLVCAFIAIAFTMLRQYIIQHEVKHDTEDTEKHLKIMIKNRISVAIYLTGALSSVESVYLSFIMFLIVPALYFIPEKIHRVETNQDNPKNDCQ